MESSLNPGNSNSLSVKKFTFCCTIEGQAILVSMVVGIVIVIIKVVAYVLSGSMAIMADMLESLVHNLAVAFAAYCLWLSYHPADDNHLYGHGKSQFLSASVEGSLVCGAGILILFNCVRAWFLGHELLDVGGAAGFALLAGIINAVLGWWLVRTGRRTNALILVANGKHVLSDVITTGAALAGMGIAGLTGLILIDLVVAALGGIYIIVEGFKLLRQSVGGLLDEADMHVDRELRRVLDDESGEHSISYHKLRHRSEGNKHWMELHLVMDDDLPLQKAHDLASHLESEIRENISEPIMITTHLEPKSSLPESTLEGGNESNP